MGRVGSDKRKVLAPNWGKVLYFTKWEFFHNIHYWKSALLTFPSDHLDSENNAYKVVGQNFSKTKISLNSSSLSFSFTYATLSSLKVSKKSLWWIWTATSIKLWAKAWVKQEFLQSLFDFHFHLLISSALTKNFRKIIVADFHNNIFDV